jgi:hypothetical protein
MFMCTKLAMRKKAHVKLHTFTPGPTCLLFRFWRCNQRKNMDRQQAIRHVLAEMRRLGLTMYDLRALAPRDSPVPSTRPSLQAIINYEPPLIEETKCSNHMVR